MRMAGKLGWVIAAASSARALRKESRAQALNECGERVPSQTGDPDRQRAQPQGRDAFDEAREKLTAAGIELIDARRSRTPRSWSLSSRRRSPAPMVIVGGGDGTLVVSGRSFRRRRRRCSRSCRSAPPTASPGRSAFRSTSTARSTSSPTARRKRIDLGCINGDYFLNAAAIGLSPMIAETRAARAQAIARPGRLSDLGGLVAVNFRPFRLTVEQMASGPASGRPRCGSPTAATTAGSS